ncbi:MAG: hypothetical protein ACRDA8_02155 [Shewanella sp.]
MSKFELNGRHFIICFDDVTYGLRLNSVSCVTNPIFKVDMRWPEENGSRKKVRRPAEQMRRVFDNKGDVGEFIFLYGWQLMGHDSELTAQQLALIRTKPLLLSGSTSWQIKPIN